MAKKKKPANAKYPWDRWFKQKKVVLERQRDYTCQPHSMGVMIRAAARERKVCVSVKIHDGRISVQVLGRRK